MRIACVTSSLVVLLACSSAPLSNPPGTSVTRPRLVAHRGASHDAPENTIAAFHKAWELGVECVELDIHLTRDHEVVVIHDDNTKRTTGLDRDVASLTLAELQVLDAGSWMSPRFAGERIPTIAEALATIPEGRTMFIEIKSGPETAGALARAIRAADPRPRGAHIALQGFDPAALSAFAAELPGVPAYWTVMPPLDDQREPLPYPTSIVAEAVRRGFPGVALLYASVDDDLVAAARAAGLLVDVWTLNDPADVARWYGRPEIRWIETDRPELIPAR